MINMIREFFGIGGYQRPAEGFLSWQHLTFVTFLMAVMTLTAVFLGRRNRNRGEQAKNRVLIIAALLLDVIEITKIVLMCVLGDDPMHWQHELPLFLCSIQLIALPVAAFSCGRMKDAALDFVCMFGILGAILGTYGAGNNYSCYPVLSFDNVVSGITHSISGFASLYIMISGMAGLRVKNLPITCGIIAFFCVAAYAANILLDCNYMFLMRGDGTPYDILYALVSGHKVLYPALVVGLFFVYIAVCYGVKALVKRR